MYQNLVRTVNKNVPESIHLCEWPETDESFIDPALEQSMDEVLSIVVLGRAVRSMANLKNRQPLSCMYVKGSALDPLYVGIIAEELNVKKVKFISDASSFISYQVKPQLKTLGPRYGKILPKIGQYLSAPGVGDAVVTAHNAGGDYAFDVDGTEVVLSAEDVLVSTAQKEGFASLTERDLTVVLDTKPDPGAHRRGLRPGDRFQSADHAQGSGL